MNKDLQAYARDQLKRGLSHLPEDQQRMFKLMYARDNGKRTVEEAEATPIDDVVDAMHESKLDWAMRQVSHSLDKL
jgi:hypothetical protein